MSLTKKEYRDAVVVLAGVYDVPLSDQDLGTVDHAVELSAQFVFCEAFVETPESFRATPATITDGDAYPSGFLGYAKSAYYTSGGIIRPFRYATVAELSALLSKLRILARATDPVLFFCDGKINTLPAGLTFTFEWWEILQSTADPSVADTATNGMPEEYDRAVIRGAFEFLTKMMVTEIGALRLTQSELKRWQDAERRLYLEKFEMQNQSFKGGNE